MFGLTAQQLDHSARLAPTMGTQETQQASAPSQGIASRHAANLLRMAQGPGVNADSPWGQSLSRHRYGDDGIVLSSDAMEVLHEGTDALA